MDEGGSPSNKRTEKRRSSRWGLEGRGRERVRGVCKALQEISHKVKDVLVDVMADYLLGFTSLIEENYDFLVISFQSILLAVYDTVR